MMRTCENDGVEFDAKRATAKYCSPKCRVEAARKVGADPATGEIIGYDPASAEGDYETTIIGERTDKGIVVHRVNQKKKPKGPGPVPIEGIPKEYDRAAALKAFQKMGLAKVEWITTGIPELDAFQQIPRGRVTQIQGPYAVGKTTLCLNMIRGLRDKKVFYVDSEASLNPELLVDLELNPKNFQLYNESAFIEDIYEVTLEAAKAGKYDMIILDSLASCTFRTEEAGAATDSNIGQKAKVVNKLMRIIPMYLKDADTALVIINQEREMIGTYVPMKYTPGGMGVPYAASLILALKTIPSWRFPKDSKNGAYKGHEIEVTVSKSKVSQPHRKAKIKLYYPKPVEQEPEDDVEPAF